MSMTLTTAPLTLSEAAEIRDTETGLRRFGSADTLRRKVKSGALPHEVQQGRCLVSRADLEALVEQKASERAFSDLRAAAKRAAALAPPISPERRELIASILRGA
ncbi:helix-turn-helix domain-containing protein [Microbacterium esteraromaticum]|uniref:helix-turn-helix domain-containing protein n=1 Tax=Microbacterium esteraromaticum TaxID=57043 RepID=UPI001C95E1C2|nr:helix-turn-helix domain-containing protein [Microbacterium esteraromaticum]MBY6062219.1 helix-turn-helix domain-containing protein [Microbacterium esteraromaticum]